MTPQETKDRKEALYSVFLESWRKNMNFWDMARRKALDIPLGESEMGDIQVTNNHPSPVLPAILGLLAGGGLIGTIGTALLSASGFFSPPIPTQQQTTPQSQPQQETKIIIEWEGTPPRIIAPGSQAQDNQGK